MSAKQTHPPRRKQLLRSSFRPGSGQPTAASSKLKRKQTTKNYLLSNAAMIPAINVAPFVLDKFGVFQSNISRT